MGAVENDMANQEIDRTEHLGIANRVNVAVVAGRGCGNIRQRSHRHFPQDHLENGRSNFLSLKAFPGKRPSEDEGNVLKLHGKPAFKLTEWTNLFII